VVLETDGGVNSAIYFVTLVSFKTKNKEIRGQQREEK
tara:strand:+ start:615 stop:725 length:111 start_codon:yes stop_codon:yes gene_type:complete